MGVKVITPPTLTDIVSLADLRKHLKLATDGTEDGLASGYFAAAHGHAEHYTSRPIGSQTLELAIDTFPEGAIELGSAATAITSVKYLDTAGVERTLASSAYTLDDYGLECWLVPAAGTVWPDTLDAANAVKVRFTAGDAPPAVITGLLLMTAWLNENPGSEAADIPVGICALLNTVKRWVV